MKLVVGCRRRKQWEYDCPERTTHCPHPAYLETWTIQSSPLSKPDRPTADRPQSHTGSEIKANRCLVASVRRHMSFLSWNVISYMVPGVASKTGFCGIISRYLWCHKFNPVSFHGTNIPPKSYANRFTARRVCLLIVHSEFQAGCRTRQLNSFRRERFFNDYLDCSLRHCDWNFVLSMNDGVNEFMLLG